MEASRGAEKGPRRSNSGWSARQWRQNSREKRQLWRKSFKEPTIGQLTGLEWKFFRIWRSFWHGFCSSIIVNSWVTFLHLIRCEIRLSSLYRGTVRYRGIKCGCLFDDVYGRAGWCTSVLYCDAKLMMYGPIMQSYFLRIAFIQPFLIYYPSFSEIVVRVVVFILSLIVQFDGLGHYGSNYVQLWFTRLFYKRVTFGLLLIVWFNCKSLSSYVIFKFLLISLFYKS